MLLKDRKKMAKYSSLIGKLDTPLLILRIWVIGFLFGIFLNCGVKVSNFIWPDEPTIIEHHYFIHPDDSIDGDPYDGDESVGYFKSFYFGRKNV